MKRVIYICFFVFLFFSLNACSKIAKTPEGLIKKEPNNVLEGLEDSHGDLSNGMDGIEDGDGLPMIHQNASLYFLDTENNRLVSESRNIVALDVDSFIDEVIAALIRGPRSEELQPVLPKETRVIQVQQIDNIVSVDLSKEFLDAENLLVARAALVNTLTDQEKIRYVKINIEGQELTRDGTQNGQPIGVLTKMTSNMNELASTDEYKSGEENLKEINRELFYRDFRGRYLISEIRPIRVRNGGIARAIIEELIKGPVGASEGLYPVIPQGTQLLDINLLDGSNKDVKVAALYFSKELKSPFAQEEFSRSGILQKNPKDTQEKINQTKNKESIILSSIVYNLSNLNNIEGVKIFYQNDDGDYINDPLYITDLDRLLTTKDFPNKLGRKIKVYFANPDFSHLVADYRAMDRENVQIAKTIIDELILGPREDTEQVEVIPPEVTKDDIKVWMDKNNTTVMVDLPGKLDGDKMGSTGTLITLYAMVNSLTDPMNTSNIQKVQFLVDGKIVKTFGNLEFSVPFIRNPAIIQE